MRPADEAKQVMITAIDSGMISAHVAFDLGDTFSGDPMALVDTLGDIADAMRHGDAEELEIRSQVIDAIDGFYEVINSQ